MSSVTLEDLGATPAQVAALVGTEILEELPPDTTQATFTRAQVIANLRVDLNFLASVALPDIFKYFFPKMFLVAWMILLEKVKLGRDFTQLAIGIPRGFAKTTLIKLFILYSILFTKKKFILIISAKESHTVNIIADVIMMLNERNIKELFGDWRVNVERDKQEIKVFSFRGRQIILAGIGADGSIRGLNVGFSRPDIMIFDDYQSKEDSENPTISDALLVKMIGTIMKAKDPTGCLFIYVANMYPTEGSILKKLKNNPTWISFIVGGILADGTSLWEALQPIKQLLAEFASDIAMGHPEVFAAEVLNDENAGLKSGIDITKLPMCHIDRDKDIPDGAAIIIDPAGELVTSDMVAIGRVAMYTGVPVLTHQKQGHFSPLQTIKEALILGLQTNTRLICVEATAYQASLLFWFEYICKEKSIEGFYFEPLQTAGMRKNIRIKDMLKAWLGGEIGVVHQLRGLVVHQVSHWNPMNKVNVDELLDILAYATKVFELYGHLFELDISLSPASRDFDAAEVIEEELACEF